MRLEPRYSIRHSSREKANPDWQQALPMDWRPAIIQPLCFATYTEHEMPASRSLGYDEDHNACYYRHVFLLSAVRSDDDEEYYSAVVYGEEVRAWRLRDGRWLVWRLIRQEGDCSSGRDFYCFSESMPA